MREKDESWGKKSTTAYSCYLLTPQVLRFQACAMMPSNRGTKSTHHPALSQFTCFLSRAYWSTRSIPPTDIDKFLFLAFASFIASVFDDPATSFRARYRPRPLGHVPPLRPVTPLLYPFLPPSVFPTPSI